GDPESGVVARLASLLPADETQLVYSMALHGRAELGLAPDEYSGLVMVLLRMLAFRPQRSGHAASAPRSAPSAASPPSPAPVARPQPAMPAVAPAATPAVARARPV